MKLNLKLIVILLIVLLAATLRFYKLGTYPASLYWDEVSLGYNAYSILKTGHDEHGKFLPLTNFAAFGDYKPPGYIYAAVPSIALFGLNEFATRLPSALFGTFTVLLTYFLARRLLKGNEFIALASAFFLAISPWHVQLSRGAFEGNLALFFSTLGIYSFLVFAQGKSLFIFISTASFLIAMYTFTGQRLFVPFILVILAFRFRNNIRSSLKVVLPTLALSILLFFPLFNFATQTLEGRLRFDEVSIFKDQEPISESISYRQRDNFSFLSGIIHNRRVFFAYEYLVNYFDSFNPSFLFTKGDVNPRLSVQELGELYYFDLALLLFGIYFLISKRYPNALLILGWLLVSPLGPATARETPHALRMIHILPTFQIISAVGMYHLFQIMKFKKVFVVFSALTVVGLLFYYLHMYYIHWWRDFSGEWQYGYKQAVEAVIPLAGEAEEIIVTKNLGRPYIYFLFYTKYDPKKYQEGSTVVVDQFRFIDVDGFDKFLFTRDVQKVSIIGKRVFVADSGQLPEGVNKRTSITSPDGSVVFDIGTTWK